MQIIGTSSGVGYTTDAQGRVMSKFVVKPGVHQIDDNLTWHELPNEAALNAIQLYEPEVVFQANRCSKLQGKLALKAAGLLTGVEALIAALPADDNIRIYWQDSTEWRRESPIIQQLGAALGLTSQQIDDLFNAAAQIV